LSVFRFGGGFDNHDDDDCSDCIVTIKMQKTVVL